MSLPSVKIHPTKTFNQRTEKTSSSKKEGREDNRRAGWLEDEREREGKEGRMETGDLIKAQATHHLPHLPLCRSMLALLGPTSRDQEAQS